MIAHSQFKTRGIEVGSIFDKEERLIQALCKQETVDNDGEAAAKLAKVVTRKIYQPDDVILNQDHCTDEMYFILSGKLAINVNDRTIAFRTYRQTVGEMCLVDVGGNRSATIVVQEESELARIEETDFTKIATEHPNLWRNIAQSLALRLRERNGRERVKNLKPKVFVASSSESKDVVESICNNFSNASVELIPWTREVLFAPSTHAIETLEANARAVDFAIIIIGPDDVVISRGKKTGAPRDNVVFELGLFMGALIERRRIFMVESTATQIKIPSDLQGLSTLRYNNETNLAALCEQIGKQIATLGTI